MRIRSYLIGLAALLPCVAAAENGFYVGGGIGGSRVEQDIGITAYSVTSPPQVFQTAPDPVIPLNELNGTDLAVKAFAGYRFFNVLAVEVGYVWLGEPEESYSFTIPEISNPTAFFRGDSDREIRLNNEIDGIVAQVVGFLPLGERFELIGKAGLINWDSDLTIQDRIATQIPVDQPQVPATCIPNSSFDCDPARLDPGSPNYDPSLSADRGGEYDAPFRRESDDGTDLALTLGVGVKVTDRIDVRAELDWFDIDNTDTVYALTASAVVRF